MVLSSMGRQSFFACLFLRTNKMRKTLTDSELLSLPAFGEAFTQITATVYVYIKVERAIPLTRWMILPWGLSCKERLPYTRTRQAVMVQPQFTSIETLRFLAEIVQARYIAHGLSVGLQISFQ